MKRNATTLAIAGDLHRLIGLSNNAGNTIIYKLDLTGNQTAEGVQDLGGNLQRQTTRAYGAVNPLQQQTGGAQ